MYTAIAFRRLHVNIRCMSTSQFHAISSKWSSERQWEIHVSFLISGVVWFLRLIVDQQRCRNRIAQEIVFHKGWQDGVSCWRFNSVISAVNHEVLCILEGFVWTGWKGPFLQYSFRVVWPERAMVIFSRLILDYLYSRTFSNVRPFPKKSPLSCCRVFLKCLVHRSYVCPLNGYIVGYHQYKFYEVTARS